MMRADSEVLSWVLVGIAVTVAVICVICTVWPSRKKR